MSSFVFLHHLLPQNEVLPQNESPADSQPESHFDLMFEFENKLLTWTVPALPIANEPAIAHRIQDHRLAYLTYEGDLSGNRGTVSRIESGECRPLKIAEGRCVFEINGDSFRGQISFQRLPESNQHWSLLFSDETCGLLDSD